MPLVPLKSNSNPSNGDLPNAGPSTVELHREALYDEVWTTPVSHLTKKYGLTDYRFRKICKALHVPTPPAGYWTKLRHGHDVEPPPLPDLPEGASETYVVQRNPGHLNATAGTSSVAENTAAERGYRVPEIRVPARLRSPHSLVIQTRDALKADHPDRYGRVGGAGKKGESNVRGSQKHRADASHPERACEGR